MILTRREPVSCKNGFGIENLDGEGRLITLEYKDYYIVNVYVPSLNTCSELERFDYRNEWNRALREHISNLSEPVTLAANMYVGFDFLSRHYQRKNDVLYATPVDKAIIIKAERELETLIMNFKGMQRALIAKINQKPGGLAAYHRITDAYMDFRHIDAVVEGLLIEFMCRKKYKHWKRETVLKKFWVKEGEHYVFVLPNDPSCRVKRIAPLEIVKHKPCKLSFNPYLARKYYNWLQERRDVQKANGKYYAIWTRQSGKCAYCGQAMLPDREVEIIENVIGEGRHMRNLQYTHRPCAYDSFPHSDEPGEHINLFSLPEGINSEAPVEKSPFTDNRAGENIPNIPSIYRAAFAWRKRQFETGSHKSSAKAAQFHPAAGPENSRPGWFYYATFESPAAGNRGSSKTRTSRLPSCGSN